jgi:hypothetical protein
LQLQQASHRHNLITNDLSTKPAQKLDAFKEPCATWWGDGVALDGGGAHGPDLYGDRHLSCKFGSRFGRLPAPSATPSPQRAAYGIRKARATAELGGASPVPGNRRAHDSGGEEDEGGRSLADGATWHAGCERRLPCSAHAAYVQCAP